MILEEQNLSKALQGAGIISNLPSAIYATARSCHCLAPSSAAPMALAITQPGKMASHARKQAVGASLGAPCTMGRFMPEPGSNMHGEPQGA